MSSVIEEDDADLRDGLRGLPLERIMLVEEVVRWIGGLEDLAGLTESGDAVGKGTEGGSTREFDGGGFGRKW
jgi:hypothetical protein